MSVSIVIPAYNAEKYLAATVHSVVAQTYGDWELVIVNDGSKDSTGELARRLAASDERIRTLDQPNGGVATSRNNGLKRSTPTRPFALFLDADDLLEPDALETLLSACQESPEAPAAHGSARTIDAEGHPLPDPPLARLKLKGRRAVSPDPAESTDSLMLVVMNCVQSPGAVLIRKDAMERWAPGGFDQSIAPAADWDMWYRLARGGPIVFTPRVVLAYRVHAASMSMTGNVMRGAGREMRRKWLDEATSPAERKLVKRGYGASLKRIARQQWDVTVRTFEGQGWQPAARMLPLTAICVVKSFPGVSSMILGFGRR